MMEQLYNVALRVFKPGDEANVPVQLAEALSGPQVERLLLAQVSGSYVWANAVRRLIAYGCSPHGDSFASCDVREVKYWMMMHRVDADGNLLRWRYRWQQEGVPVVDLV